MNVVAPPTDLAEGPLPLTLPAPPAPLWRPGIEEPPKMVPEEEREEDEDEEEEEDEEDEEEEEENGTSLPDFKTGEDSCGSPDLRKQSPASKKGSREQTKIQPLRLDSGLEAFRCPLCFPDCAPANCTPIAGRKALTEHLRWHQNQEQQPEGRFACCYCAKELSSYSSLDRHLLTHTNFRPFVCNQCKRDFTTNGNLNRHVKTSHQGQRSGTTMAALTEEIATSAAAPVPPKARPAAPKLVAEPRVGSASPKTGLDLPAASAFPHSNSFSLQQPASIPSFAPSCLPLTPVAAAAAAAASALIPSSTTPAFSSFASPYNTAQWLAMLMRGYGGNSPMMSLPVTAPGPFLPPGPSPGLLAASSGPDHLDLPAGRPMPVLTPQSAAAAVVPDPEGARSASPDSTAKSPPLRAVKRLGAKKAGVTRLRLADSKKLLYKAGLQHWGRVLRGRAIDFLKRKRRRSPLKKDPVVSTPMSEDPTCPLDLSVRPSGPEPTRPAPAPVTPDLERPFPALPHLPALTPANGANQDDSVLDLSVRSSSISDGASPPNGAPGLALTEPFVPSLLAQHGVPIFHMRQNDSPPSIQLQSLLESNNNCAKADALFGVLDPKKKIDEAAKIFTGRYAKRRPQKKTHLAPPTLNPFLKMGASTPTEAAPSQMEVESPLSEPRPDSSAVNRKKNSYKDAPNRMLCPIEGCEQQFPWKSSLKRHVITHYDFKPYKCVTCGRHFSTKSNRERHIERLHGHRNKRPGRVPRSVVEDCVEPEDAEVAAAPLATEDIESMNFSDMKADRMSEEILEKAGTIVTAPNPERLSGAFATTRLSRQSSGSEVRPSAREASPKASVCCHCHAEVSGGAQAMQLHLLTAHPSGLPPAGPAPQPAADNSVFKCPVCAREFPRQEPALEHMRLSHPSEWAMTASKLNVDSLIQGSGWGEGPSSSGEEEASKRVLCPVCRRKFASFQDLQRHARSHTGERPFACSFCGREFALKHSLNRHMRTHGEEA